MVTLRADHPRPRGESGRAEGLRGWQLPLGRTATSCGRSTTSARSAAWSAARYRERLRVVRLAADVAASFADEDAVNAALREYLRGRSPDAAPA